MSMSLEHEVGEGHGVSTVHAQKVRDSKPDCSKYILGSERIAILLKVFECGLQDTRTHVL